MSCVANNGNNPNVLKAPPKILFGYKLQEHIHALTALACYGEKAVPVIIEAFENGLSGRKAANAKAALSAIKADDYRNFVRQLRTTMSSDAFNEFIKYNTQ